MQDMRERQLAVRSDRITMSGKVIVTVAAGTSGTQVFSPAALGDRIFKVASIFARWRIVKLIIVSGPVSTTGAFSFGVVDDNSSEGGSAPLPTTVNEVVELRCSKFPLSSVNPNEIEWKPVDPQKWYYTSPGGGTGSDNRFVYPSTLAYAATSAPSAAVSFGVYYTTEFEGAFDNTS
jgi:hypothetical protein